MTGIARSIRRPNWLPGEGQLGLRSATTAGVATRCGIGALPGRSADPDRQASLPPAARVWFEQPRDRGAAGAAAAIRLEPPCGDLIPVATDDASAATRAIGALARFIMDVAGIDKVETHVPGDITGHGQRARWCGGEVLHLVVRVEGREMQGHVRPEPRHHPLAEPLHFLRAVVVARDQ